MYEVNIEKANENEKGVHNSVDNLHDDDNQKIKANDIIINNIVTGFISEEFNTSEL